MAEIKFTIDTNTGEVKQGFNEVGDAVNDAKGKMNGMSGVAKKLGGALLGVASAGKAMQLIGDSFSSSTASAMELSDAMTPLIALGDNAQNYKQVSEQITMLRENFGATAEEVSQLKFNIQSGGAALDDMTKNGITQMSLLSKQVAGIDTSLMSKAALKAFNIFGKEAGNVVDVFNKFAMTADRADAGFNDLAGTLPEVMSAAKSVGGSFEEALGAAITLTAKAGDARSALTNLRNMFVALDKAQKEGIITAKEFSGRLKQFGELDSLQKLKIAGSAGVASFNALSTSVGTYKEQVKDLRGVTGNLFSDMKKYRLEADKAFAVQTKLNKFEQQKKTIESSDEAVIASTQFELATEQFMTGLTALALKVGGSAIKMAEYSPVGAVLNKVTDNSLETSSSALFGQAEIEDMKWHLAGRSAREIANERNTRQTRQTTQTKAQTKAQTNEPISVNINQHKSSGDNRGISNNDNGNTQKILDMNSEMIDVVNSQRNLSIDANRTARQIAQANQRVMEKSRSNRP